MSAYSGTKGPGEFPCAIPEQVDIDMAQEAIDYAQKELATGNWDILILDEVNVALDYKLIKLSQVLEMVKAKPAHTELILTGRSPPQEILEIADLVSEVHEVKHPFRDGVEARKGIEF